MSELSDVSESERYGTCDGERLIRTKDTTVLTRSGLRRNGNLRYTIQPLEKVLAARRQADLQKIQVEAARWEREKSASL